MSIRTAPVLAFALAATNTAWATDAVQDTGHGRLPYVDNEGTRPVFSEKTGFDVLVAATRDDQLSKPVTALIATPGLPVTLTAYAESRGEDHGAKAVERVKLNKDAIFGKIAPGGHGGATPADRLGFQLAGRTVHATRDLWARNADGSVTWMGSNDDGSGDVVLTRVGDSVYGIVQTEFGMVVVESDGIGTFLTTMDSGAANEPSTCGADEEVSAPSANNSTAMASETSAMTASALSPPSEPAFEYIDILVVYTKEVTAIKGGAIADVEAYIWTIAHVTNRIWERSGITTHRLRVVHTEEVVSTGQTDTVNQQSDFVGLIDRGPEWDNDKNNFSFPYLDAPVCQSNDMIWDSGWTVEPTDPTVADRFIPDLRDTVGADVIGVLLQKGYDAIGCASQSLPSASKGNNLGTTFTQSATNKGTQRWSFAHELGHVLGLRHQSQSQNGAGFRVTPSGSDPGYASLMHNQDGQNTPRLPALSNDGLYWTPGPSRIPPFNPWNESDEIRTDGTYAFISTTGSYVVGSSTNDSVGFLTNGYDPGSGFQSATPLEVTAAYRAEGSIDYVAAAFTSPSDRADITTSSFTFTWPASDHALTLAGFDTDLSDTGAGADIVYVLDVGTSFGADDLCTVEVAADDVTLATSTYNVPITCLPGSSTPFFVRFWTEVSSELWQTQDYAFNTTDRLIDCGSENPNFSPGDWNSALCDITAGTDICTLSSVAGGDMLRCDLNQGASGSITPDGIMVGKWQGDPSNPYDFTMYGEDASGTHFCCLYDERIRDIEVVRLWGTGGTDVLSLFALGNASLRPVGASSLSATVLGKAGNDIIFGSRYDGSSYTEFLVGNTGNDYIATMEGDDEASGGQGDDILIGSLGDDVLIGNSGTDWLSGGEGNDVLCSPNKGDLMEGALGAEFAINIVYVSSTATGSFDPDTFAGGFGACGHTTHGSGWADDPFSGLNCSYSLTTAPAACSLSSKPNYGIPD